LILLYGYQFGNAVRLQRLLTDMNAPANEAGQSADSTAYLRTVIVAIACCGVLAFGALIYVRHHGEVPPFPLSGILCLDEKARIIRGLHTGSPDIIAVGSSMTLNSLSSDTLLSEIPGHLTMLNIAVWGMKISETQLWLQHVTTKLGGFPRIVLMCITPSDFDAEIGWYEIAEGHLADYLGGGSGGFAGFSLLNYLRSSRHMKEYRTSRQMYESLDFDSGGSVPLEISFPNVDMSRWDLIPAFDQIDERQYQALDRLAAELKARGVLLVCVQTPARAASRAKEDRAEAEKYNARVAGIMRKNGQLLLNFHAALDLDDASFADGLHLNARGARALSQALGRELVSMPGWQPPPPPNKK
jgi:hypothetical protein